ncbi:MAG TPA: proline racemase family protein [Planctomycetota bacterium]
MPRRVEVVDSHTGGEPTRVVVAGGPDLGTGSVRERLARFAREHDRFRSAVVNEPRGSDVLVGALLLEPSGVIFFNNVGTIGMCGHGTMGVVVTLQHLKRLVPARLETAVGAVDVEALGGGRVRVGNVPSWRTMKDVKLDVPGHGVVTGDVAWGGNWFFLAEIGELGPIDRLTALSWAIRRELVRRGIAGEGGAEIDHIELFGPSKVADSRNFVLCPGGAYDRSPCGTGTSAKVACLIADGKLREGQVWRQESVIGSVFEASGRIVEGRVRPTITGSAFVTAESTLLLDPEDPFVEGIRC